MTVFSSRKGQTFLDVLAIALVLFGAAVGFIFISMIQKEIVIEMTATEEFDPATTEAGRVLQNFDDHFTTALDNGFLITFVLLWVFIIVSGLFVDASPIFLIISVILLVVILITVGVMSNAYETIMVDDVIFTFAAGFPKMNYVMEHLVMLCVFIAFSGMIAIYGKNTLGGGF